MKALYRIRSHVFRHGGHLELYKSIEAVFFLFIDKQELWNGLNRKEAMEKYKFYLGQGDRQDEQEQI